MADFRSTTTTFALATIGDEFLSVKGVRWKRTGAWLESDGRRFEMVTAADGGADVPHVFRSTLQSWHTKLSDPSIKFGSEEHLTLEIEQTMEERSETLLEQVEAGLIYDDQLLDRAAHRAIVSSTSQRAASMGDHLWDLKRRLRMTKEDAGKLALLTPDGRAAFTAALLQIHKDPTFSAKRSKSQQSEMRPVIPDRTSSLHAVKRRRVEIRESQEILRRQLSDECLELGSIKHLKLRIKQAELEKEESHLDRDEAYIRYLG
ncbi:MAG: hypothetical protein M1826_001184 [Phylliscum demangeonii]|nr:MAG: hypothetical protein M1826_001184 [Phylliscum demangeonii]